MHCAVAIDGCASVRECVAVRARASQHVGSTHRPNSNYKRPHVCGQKTPTHRGVWCSACCAWADFYLLRGRISPCKRRSSSCTRNLSGISRTRRRARTLRSGCIYIAFQEYAQQHSTARSSHTCTRTFERDDVIRKAHVSRKREQEAGRPLHREVTHALHAAVSGSRS